MFSESLVKGWRNAYQTSVKLEAASFLLERSKFGIFSLAKFGPNLDHKQFEPKLTQTFYTSDVNCMCDKTYNKLRKYKSISDHAIFIMESGF